MKKEVSEIVFALIKYKNAEKIDIFINGEDLFFSNEIHQAIEDDGIAWDELRLIDYSKKSLYDRDLQDFNIKKNKLDKYRILSIKRYSYLKKKYNTMKIKINNLISDDTSIPRDRSKKETPKQKRLRVEGNRPNLGNFKIIQEKSKLQSRPMYFVNLIKTREIAMYPIGYEGKQISGRKALDIYSRIAYKYNNKHKNRFLIISDVKNTIADNTGTETDWETFAIVKYQSLDSLIAFNSEPMFIKSFVHKDAGIDTTYVYASFSNNNKNAIG